MKTPQHIVLIAALLIAGASARNNNDPQTSLTLDKSQVQTGLQEDGNQEPADGQSASQTSGNNFINFCMTRSDLPLTNGKQVKAGSCNGTPMGVIAAQNRMPSSKFISPRNLANIPANQDFTIQMKVNNLNTGNFVNAKSNFFGAPQNTDSQGYIIGHSHFVIENMPNGFQDEDVPDPTQFAFFKGVNAPARNGVLSEQVKGGLPAGSYKLSSINSAANHQPVLVGVAQHGSLDDAVYFTVSDNGNQNQNAGANNFAVTNQAASQTNQVATNQVAAQGNTGLATNQVAAQGNAGLATNQATTGQVNQATTGQTNQVAAQGNTGFATNQAAVQGSTGQTNQVAAQGNAGLATNQATTGQVNQAAVGQVNQAAAGQVNQATTGQVNQDTTGQVNQGAVQGTTGQAGQAAGTAGQGTRGSQAAAGQVAQRDLVGKQRMQ